MALNNGLHSLNVDEIDPYDHGRDVVHVVRTGRNFVDLPMFLLDLTHVGNNLDPLCLHHVVHDAAPLNDRSLASSLYPLVVGRRGDPLLRHRGDSWGIVSMVLLEVVLPCVVNGFAWKLGMLVHLYHLHDHLPLARWIRRLSSSHLKTSFHY